MQKSHDIPGIWDCSAWRRGGSGAVLSMCISAWWEDWRRQSQTLLSGTQRHDKRQWAQIGRHKTLIENTVRVVEHQNSTKKLWSFYPSSYSKPNWTQSWATRSSWSCCKQSVLLDDLQRCLSTSANLWFSRV